MEYFYHSTMISPEVSKVKLERNSDEMWGDDFFQKSKADKALNDDFKK